MSTNFSTNHPESPLVYFVGAGPGAEDLITQRGALLLETADVVVYAGSLVNPAHLARCRKDCTCYDSAKLSLEEQVDILSSSALEGKKVIRLHTGDPSMYGAIAEQIEGLRSRGAEPEIVPGVSSVFAAAAALKTELTYPGLSQSLILTRTAGRTPMPDGENPTAFAKTGATLAFFLSMSNIQPLVNELQEAGMEDSVPVAIVYRASWPDERIIRGTLGTIAALASESGIGRQALILVGKALDGKGAKSKLYDHAFSHGYRNHLQKEQFNGSIAFYAFTDKGVSKAIEMSSAVDNAHIFTTREHNFQEKVSTVTSAQFDALLARNWHLYDAHVFIGSTGIAVRKIAPLLVNKTSDPAVVSCTEEGSYLVSLASGHLGGANRLCRKLARITGGQAIVSTATDGRNITAFDEAASQEDARILNPQAIKKLNIALLNQSSILFDGPEEYYMRYWADIPNIRHGKIDEANEGEATVLWSEQGNPPDLTPENCLLIESATYILGIGCKKDISPEFLERTVEEFLTAHSLSKNQVSSIASCDLKEHEPALLKLGGKWKIPLEFFTRDQLAKIETPTPSKTVQEKIGIPSVAEASALLASHGQLKVFKTKYEGMTLALARRPHGTTAAIQKRGKVVVVGLGSGSPAHITPEVSSALEHCDQIAGYTKYIDFIRDRIGHKPLIQTGMLGEVVRCQATLQAAVEGNEICMVCSGDPGILAMAGLLYELQEKTPAYRDIEIKVLPGITAANIAAASLGAPLQNGFCLISLSDLLVQAEEVRKNLTNAAQTELPVVLYNPAGRKRRHLMQEALEIFKRARGEQTLSAIVRHAGRPQEEKWIGTLANFPEERVDMSSLILIGGHRTRLNGRILYEARGYEDKYDTSPKNSENQGE
ncbi:MAG: precorrin-4 C(11)-methyltransferase [Akkermansia sp.]